MDGQATHPRLPALQCHMTCKPIRTNSFTVTPDQCDLHRGFIKGRALGKLTGCERDLAINLPSCFHLLFLLTIIKLKIPG